MPACLRRGEQGGNAAQNDRLRPEKLPRNCFRTGVRLPSPPPSCVVRLENNLPCNSRGTPPVIGGCSFTFAPVLLSSNEQMRHKLHQILRCTHMPKTVIQSHFKQMHQFLNGFCSSHKRIPFLHQFFLDCTSFLICRVNGKSVSLNLAILSVFARHYGERKSSRVDFSRLHQFYALQPR